MRLTHANVEVSDRVRQVDVVKREKLAGRQRPPRGEDQHGKKNDYKPATASETHASS
jgi:hypothetical protein